MHAHKEILINLAKNMQAYGYSEAEMFNLSGFNIDEVSDSEGMVDEKYGITLWENIIRIANYPLVGLSFGRNINFSALSWISGLTQSASNLKDAWKSFCDFSLLMGDMFYYQLKEEGEKVCVYFYPNEQWMKVSPVTAYQACDHAMSLCLTLSSFLSDKKIEAEKAYFQHEIATSNLPEYERVFNQILSNQKENKIVFSIDTANLQVITANELVYKHMLEFCENKLKELNKQESYASKINNILMKKNSFQLPKIDEVSAILHLNTRTLQRKLKEENTDFKTILNDYQIEQAKYLLTQKNIQTKEIAYLLGYTSTESFHRSFKRNMGISPGEFKLKTKT